MEVPEKKTNASDKIWLTRILKHCYDVPQSSAFTFLVSIYEIGDIAKCFIRAKRYGPEGYKDEQIAACADARTMIGLLIEQLGYNLREVDEYGIERLKERMNDIRKRGNVKAGFVE